MTGEAALGPPERQQRGVTVASDCLAGLIVAYKPVASLTPRTKPKAPPLSPVLTKIRFQPARN